MPSINRHAIDATSKNVFYTYPVRHTLARRLRVSRQYEKLTFSSPLEEESDHQDLQSSHAHHHAHLNQAEVEDPLFGAPDRAEIAVLSCPEVFLHPADRAQLSAHFEDHVFEDRGLFGG